MSQTTSTAAPGTTMAGAPLNILIGLEGLALGGCPINALDLGRTLRERGHRVDVFAIDEQVRVSLLPYAESAGFDPTVLSPRAGTVARAHQIAEVAAEHRADIIHVFAPWLAPAAAIAAAGSARRTAVLATNWMMENVSYTPQSVPQILGTALLRDEAQEQHRSPVWLLEPPIDLVADHPDPERGRRFREQHGIGDDELAAVIVTRVGRHMKAESLGYAISAVQQLDRPGFRLVIVGDGDAFAEIEAQADAANAALGRPAILLTGSMADPRPAYAAADLTLAMGGSALRSLAHAKPLIVLGVNGFARTFTPETTPYFYRFGFFGEEHEADPVGHLAGLIAESLPADRRAELGRYGLAEVEGRFGLEVGAVALEQMYRESLARLAPRQRRWIEAGGLIARAAIQRGRSVVQRLRRTPRN